MKIKIVKDGVIIRGKDIPNKLSKYIKDTNQGKFIHKLAFLYVLEKNMISTANETMILMSFDDILMKLKKHDPYIFSKYLIYRDLTDRGYYVEEGYGRGIDLLVYDKGSYPDKPPTFRVIGVEEGEYISVKDILDELYFSTLNKKKLVLAVIERRGEVIYYSIGGYKSL
jgi:tRNA-intron endonuclease